MPAMPDASRNPDPLLSGLYAEHLGVVRDRHDHALEKAGADCVVVFSGRPRTAFLDDQDYPFVANPHFLSWVPLDAVPMSYIVYRGGELPKLIYYQPKDYWHVVPAAPSGYWTSHFDIRVVHGFDAIEAHMPADPEKCILIGEIEDPADAFGIDRLNPKAALNVLHYARGIKTEYELACMRLASRRAVRGHRAAESAFRDGASEFEIHRAYCGATGHTDNELPYANIVALNAHGAILHYTDLDRVPPADTHSLLIDAGACVKGYAADITRTYACRDQRFAELIDLMDNLQLGIVDRISEGMNFTDLHIDAHRSLAEVLVTAGVAKGNPDTLLATGVTSAFFPHGLGHLLGLQVHDVGGHMRDENGAVVDPPDGHPFLRLTRDLQADMVLTIEPGLYAIDLLLDELRGTPGGAQVVWKEVDWLRPFGGIRIEDNVRVTADGCENLTRDALAA